MNETTSAARPVCVITGGGSGMGRATANLMAERGYHVILVGRTAAKLENAVNELQATGGSAEAFSCDVADRDRCFALADHAAAAGPVKAVLHIAGLSPHMGDAATIMRGNALGTVNINDAFYRVIAPGGCVVDTSSMSAYLAPGFIMPRGSYPLVRRDAQAFLRKMMRRVNLFPNKTRPGVAYSISKNFVVWYALTDAMRFGEKGARVVCVTPGNFETPMGELEAEEATAYLKFCAVKRLGEPEEIAQLIAAVADERMGYLTGVDIICDGGCVAGKTLKR